jgi:hypothetical protein
MVVDPPEIIAVEHGSEGAVEGQDFEAVAREVEFANDLRAQEGNNVGADGELEAGEDLFSDGGAAENVTPFRRSRRRT